jgi:hypothetical protein
MCRCATLGNLLKAMWEPKNGMIVEYNVNLLTILTIEEVHQAGGSDSCGIAAHVG